MFTYTLFTSPIYRKMYKSYISPLWWAGSYINVMSAVNEVIANKDLNK